MPDYLSIHYVIFEFYGYQMSLVELVGTLFGLLSVWFAARSNILTWPVTLVNTIAFFLVFYQVRLYSDMLLQIYFFSMAIYGWYYWSSTFVGESKPIARFTRREMLAVVVLVAFGSASLGLFMSHVDTLLPTLFSQPANFPYVNAFSATLSVVANFMMARRKLENWLLWILVDIICVVVYAVNGIWLMSLEYLIFMVICIYGYRSWKGAYLMQPSSGAKVGTR